MINIIFLSVLGNRLVHAHDLLTSIFIYKFCSFLILNILWLFTILGKVILDDAFIHSMDAFRNNIH